jgi:hypothetical protein
MRAYIYFQGCAKRIEVDQHLAKQIRSVLTNPRARRPSFVVIKGRNNYECIVSTKSITALETAKIKKKVEGSIAVVSTS